MTVQEIEAAVLKQLPFRKKLLNREFATQDIFKDAGMIIICGLASVHVPKAQEKVVAYYDINLKHYIKNVQSFWHHQGRVKEVMQSYGVVPDDLHSYRSLSDAFWKKHNKTCTGELYKDGVILAHVLSSKRSLREFLKEPSVFKESDFVSFFIYNKTQLTRNFLNIRTGNKKYVDVLNFAY